MQRPPAETPWVGTGFEAVREAAVDAGLARGSFYAVSFVSVAMMRPIASKTRSSSPSMYPSA